MQLQWVRHRRGFHEFPVPFPGVWPLDEGVYIIWQFTGPTIYVGQGHIAERLYRHSISPRIMQHEPGLRVTWANVEPNSRSGVEWKPTLRPHFIPSKVTPFLMCP